MMLDEQLTATPPLDPPNGHAVTNGELYQALYQMDKRIGERDTSLINLMVGVRTDLSNHTKDGHPFTERAEIIKEEIKLDMKKLGLSTVALGIVGTIVTFVVGIIRGHWGIS